jgi:protease-4
MEENQNPPSSTPPTSIPSSAGNPGSSTSSSFAATGAGEIKKRHLNPLAVVLGLSAVLFGLFLVFSFVYFMVKGNGIKDQDEAVFDAGRGEYVAVIELKGAIMDSKKMLKKLKAAAEEKEIKAVVLQMNSPGGAVAPSQEIYEAVKKFPKPLVVSMESVAASGAYYIAAGSKKVFANAGTLTGSIGVIMSFANMKKLYDWAKIERFSIKTGKFKDSGAEYRDMNPEEKAYFQELVMDTLVQFKDAVAAGRKLSPEEVDAVADGRVFTGVQAKKLKLVDEIGTLEDAVAFAAKEAKIKGKPKTVLPKKKQPGLRDLFIGSEDDEEDFEESSSFIDRLTAKIADRITGVSMSDRQALKPGIYWIWNGAN